MGPDIGRDLCHHLFMGRRDVAGLLAGVCLAAGLGVLAGCGSAPGPTDAQIDAETLPSVVSPPNDHSDTGGCALITPEQVSAAVGAEVVRTSSIGLGCAWIGGGGTPGELLASLRQVGNQDGDGAREFAKTLATAEDSGPVEQVPGLGEQAFRTTASTPTVWWLQGQQVYAVAVVTAPSTPTSADAALELARIASGNLPG